jgi:hypothetical protein
MKNAILSRLLGGFLLLLSQISPTALDFWEKLVYDDILSLKDILFF